MSKSQSRVWLRMTGATMVRWRKHLFALMCIPLLNVCVSAADNAQPSSVTIPVVVMDDDGTPLTNVTQSDLVVLGRGKSEHTIVSLSHGDQLPLRLGVLIDTSSSERGNVLFQAAIQALTPFLKQVLRTENDKVFVETFEREPSATEFMTGAEFDAHSFNLRTGGTSALYDAVDFACSKRLKADSLKPARRVVLMLTDGQDNQSRLTREQAVKSAQEAGVVIFAVSTSDVTYDVWNESLRKNTMTGVAEPTGGNAFDPLSPNAFPQVFSDIAVQINAMYLLTFIPSQPERFEKARSIEVKPQPGKKLKIRAPKQYYSQP